MSTRVLVADDHTMFRHGIRHILTCDAELEVVGEACDGREAVSLSVELTPDVAIIDLAMPRLNGAEAIRQILHAVPSTRVLVLSMYHRHEQVEEALRAGARGYVVKEAADEELVQAVKAVAAGGAFFSPTIAMLVLEGFVRLVSRGEGLDPYDGLSRREREILQLLAEGKSNDEIGGVLEISPATVATHRAKIFRKLDVHSAGQLVLYATRRGLVS